MQRLQWCGRMAAARLLMAASVGIACSSGSGSPATVDPSGSAGIGVGPGAGGGSSNGGAAGSSTTGPSAGGSIGGSAGVGGAAGSVSSGGGGAAGANLHDGGIADSGRPPGPPSICDGSGTRVLALANSLVDDFEAAVISPAWSAFSDVMPAHDIFKMTLVTNDGAATTKHSGEYKGMGVITTAQNGFGAGTVFNTAIDPKDGIYCVDISAFDGVSFWAKAAKTGSKVSVNFVLPETNATSKDAQGLPNGGDCTSQCYAHPNKMVTLTDQWVQYTVKFSEAGGGTATVQDRIQELLWITPDSTFDFSLDEIAFYKGMPPPGPVGP